MTRRGRNRIIWIFIVVLFVASYLPHLPSGKYEQQGTASFTENEVVLAPTQNRPEVPTPLPPNLPGLPTLTRINSPASPTLPTTTDIAAFVTETDVLAQPTYDAVTIGALRVRSGPGPVYPQVSTLSSDVSVTVLGHYEKWLLVTTGTHLSGWVLDTGLVLSPGFDVSSTPSLTPPDLDRHHAVLNRKAAVYAGPGTYFAVTARDIPASTRLNVAGHTPDKTWALVADTQGAAGWLPTVALDFQPGFNLEETAIINTLPPVTVQTFEWGGQTHDLHYAGLMRDLGMSWAKIQYKWRPDSKPSDVQALIGQAHTAGLKILLAIPGQPYPDAIDYQGYITFLRGVAALDPPPDAIEVWNEMNIDFEWPVGSIDPAVYVNQMLAPAYTTIKEVNPHILVVSGAPAPTGFDNGKNAWSDERYVAGMVQAGAIAYLDCVGVHYNAGATSPTAVNGHPGGDHYGWYYLPSLAMYYRAFGGQRPLCITEIGYLAQGGYHGKQLPKRFWWAENTTLEQQGMWLAEAISLAEKSRIVQMFIVFNVNIHHWDEFDPQGGYSLVRLDGSCPACDWLGDDALASVPTPPDLSAAFMEENPLTP